MKNIFILSFLSFLLFFTSCGGERDEKDLANEVMTAFINDDARLFKQLYVRQADIEALLTEYNVPEQLQNDLRRRLRSKTAFWRIISKQAFHIIRIRGFDKGIDWHNIEINEIKIEPSNFGFFDFDNEMVKKYGLPISDIYIEFTSNGNQFEMKLDDCIKTSRGWCLSEEVRVRKRIE